MPALLVTFALFIVEILQLALKSIYFFLESIFRTIVPLPRKSVKGQIVLITGGGNGLGREIALLFGKLEAKVVLLDLNQEKNEETAKNIQQIGGTAYAYQCDISDHKNVEAVAQKIKEEIGDVTVLINNAGILMCQPILTLTDSQIKKTIEINVLGHFWTIKQFLPRMLELDQGHIVAISSIAGFLGNAHMTDYCASKHAVIGMMASLREELKILKKENSIHLTTVCPITIDTGLAQKPRTRFPSLLPILKVDKVAEVTVDSILRNKYQVLIPARVNFFVLVHDIFPLKVSDLCQAFVDYTTDPNNSQKLVEESNLEENGSDARKLL